MTNAEYNNIVDILQYGVRLYRRYGFAYKLPDSSPINVILTHLDSIETSRLIYHVYPTVKKITKPMEDYNFVYERPICDLFYSVKNYVMQYHGKPSFGVSAKDNLNKYIHNIPTDYQIVHKLLFNDEDEGYYRFYGWIKSPIISLVGASTQYANHNKYNISVLYPQNFQEDRSIFPTNNKYWFEQSQLLFICKNSVPNFYINTDVVKPDGTLINNIYWQVNFGTRTIGSISVFTKPQNQLMIETFSNNYKVSNQITTSQSIPSGSKICAIKELHIPDTYTYTANDIQICSGIAQDFYTGVEHFIPDFIYQLPTIIP